MNGHALSKHSLSYEESMVLLDEKSLSDIESDAGRADLESRFSTRTRIWMSAAQACASGLRAISWRSLVVRTAIFLLPSFVQPRFSRDPRLRSAGEHQLGPTAYLDGMRGLAALFVFFCHYFYTCFIIAQGWGYGENNYHFLKLPFIRLFYQGPPMVCVFFVISGYALSLKPLKLMRARNWEGFATAMTSFTFRRGFRLFLPTAVSTLLIVCLLRAGLYEWTRDFAHDARYLRNVQEIHYERLDTTAAQLGDWGRAMFDFVHVWGWEKFGGSTGIDVHLWTIPVEFRSSMMLFATLVGTARLRAWLRLAFVGLIMWFTYRSDRWEMLLFYAGMVLAEVDLIRGAHSNPATTAAVPAVAEYQASLLSLESSTPTAPRRRRATSLAWIATSILALYFMSQPDQGGEETPGWVFLTSLIPEWWSDKYRYWQTIGAVLFVLAVGRLPGWQRFFNTGPVQYLGKLSYAIYLVHGPVMHTAGYAIERAAWVVTGVEDEASYNRGFVLASVFVVPLVVWVADVFWRAVDAPVVRFAKWFETKCSISN